MTATPAAWFARLKVNYPSWRLERSLPTEPLEYKAVNLATRERFTAHSLPDLEQGLIRRRGTNTGARA